MKLFIPACLKLLFWCFLFQSSIANAQTVVVSATEFDPNPENVNSLHFSIENIVQTGVQPGILTSTPPWIGQMPLTDIRKHYNHMVTNNPANLNTVLTDFYIDSPDDYMYILTPASSSVQNVFEYRVINMVPNTPVTVTIKLQNIINSNSTSLAVCKFQPASLRAVINPGFGQELAGTELQPQMKPGDPAITIDVPGVVDPNGIMSFRLNQVYKNQCGDIGITKLVVKGHLSPTSVKEVPEIFNSQSIIYPNPSFNSCKITFPIFGKYSVTIYNEIGKNIYATTLTGLHSEISDEVLSPGTYIILIEGQNTSERFKFFKIK